MEEIDLKEVFRTFLNKKFQVLLILELCVIAGVIYTFNFVTPKYTSNATLILTSVNTYKTDSETSSVDATAIDRDISVNSKLVSTYSELIKSKNILRQVKEMLDIEMDEDDLKKEINVSTVEDTEIIQISVTDEDPEQAAEIANSIAYIFKDQVKNYFDIENVQMVDSAEADDEPSNIHHKRDIAIFLLVGMVVSAGYVLIVNMLDTTIKNVEDIETITNHIVLAIIPLNETMQARSKTQKKIESKLYSEKNIKTSRNRRRG